jgi:uncharacterized damage-inducible protein DinB
MLSLKRQKEFEIMSGLANQLHTEIVREVRRRLVGESIPRALKCLEQLSECEVWQRPNENSNSIGNLVLHLCGNARQWLIAGLGAEKDDRNRQQEFGERGPIATQDLVAKLNSLSTDIDTLLDQLDVSIHTRKNTVQGFEESGFAILLHVVEHFSYHVGQISYVVKLRKDINLNYYGDQNLDATS